MIQLLPLNLTDKTKNGITVNNFNKYSADLKLHLFGLTTSQQPTDINKMTMAFILHKKIAFSINIIIVGLLIYFVKTTDSDKSPIIFMVFYPALILLNGLILTILWLVKSPQKNIYSQTSVGLLLLFVPLVFIISQL